MKKSFTFASFLTLSSTVFADEAAALAKQPSMIENLVPFVLIFVLMYFLVIRPQVKKTKEHSQLIGALQVGDEVVTSGGIVGRIRSISDTFVVLDLGSTTVKILKEHITRTSFPKNASTKTNGKDVKEKEEKND